MSKRVKASKDTNPSPPKRVKNVPANPKRPPPRIAPNGYRLPDPLPDGEVVLDNTRNQWTIGKAIGCGGFGEIYAARPVADKSESWDYVVKIDHNTGPLYAEMYFYHRVAKEDTIRSWMRERKLFFLGMPRYIASGIHERLPCKYRFLVMQRFGEDLQKKLAENNNTFALKTAYTIASKVIDILEYIHSFGYIHADIKASNLLLGRSRAPTPKGKGILESQGFHSEVWLVDFGLAEKYQNGEGKHREYEEDQRRANNGTVEFTSRDAHIGALSRRSDLEILAFNVLSWLSGGRLPWMSNLKDHKYVQECKKYYMERLHELFNYAFKKPGTGGEPSPPPKTVEEFKMPRSSGTSKFDKNKLSVKSVPAGLQEFFQYVINLDFKQKPDYALLKEILSKSMAKEGGDDGRFSFSPVKKAKGVAKVTSRLKRSSLSSPQLGHRGKGLFQNTSAEESEEEESPAKRPRGRQPRRDVAKPTKAAAKGSRSVPPTKKIAASSLSAPNSSTPQKNAQGHAPSPPSKSPFENPTPAMLEMMRKLKEKRLLANGGKQSAANKLLHAATVTANKVKTVKGKLKSTSGSDSSPAAKSSKALPKTSRVGTKIVKKGGRPRSQSSSVSPVKSPAVVDLDSTVTSEEEITPVKKPKGGPRKNSKAAPRTKALESPPISKQLSSNSSTHSTKENKRANLVAGARRSPRGHN